MLEITVLENEMYDESINEFIQVPRCTLRLEHSLVSIAKWESKWHKPFLVKDPKTVEETRDYVKCMTITQNVNPNVYYGLSEENMEAVNEYISADMTATWFRDDGKQATSKQVITSELIYYWMIALGIPWEAQKWHFSRLMTLIRICSIQNAPKKKMTKQEIIERNRALNAQRRAKLGSKG